MNPFVRFNDGTTQPVVFTNDPATTGGFNLAVYSGAMLLVTATSSGSATTVTFVAKANAGSPDAFTVADSANVPVTLSLQAGRAYQLPDELFASAYVMAVTASGTVTCQVVTKS
jgi:hypothetical protein